MGESNSKARHFSKHDQLMYTSSGNDTACGRGRNQHKSNIESTLIDSRLQEIKIKDHRIAEGIRCRERQPNERPVIRKNHNEQEEMLWQGNQVPCILNKTKNLYNIREPTGTMKRRKNRKNIEKQLIENLANTEITKLKKCKCKSLEEKTDNDRNGQFCKDNKISSDIPIANGNTSNNSTQPPVLNQQNIYGQPPPPYSPHSVHVFNQLPITNVLPDLFASNTPSSKNYQNEVRRRTKSGEKQSIAISNIVEHKHENDDDEQQMKNKRKNTNIERILNSLEKSNNEKIMNLNIKMENSITKNEKKVQ